MNSCADKALVIGYGNTLRGDDGIGVIAAQQLARLLPTIQVEIAHQLTPELMESISQAAKVIFIDASLVGIPGTINHQAIKPADEVLFTHLVSPSGLLVGAKALYGNAPPAFLITITGMRFELDETLSDVMLRALPEVIALAQKLLATF